MTGRKAFVLFLSFILILSLLFPLVSCSGKPAEAQFTYISNYMKELESAIYQGGSFEELLDLDSYIDYYLIEELSGNRDGYRSSSTYLVKEKDDKLVFGPLWDFDYVSWSGGLAQ